MLIKANSSISNLSGQIVDTFDIMIFGDRVGIQAFDGEGSPIGSSLDMDFDSFDRMVVEVKRQRG